jgi:hypothetical protein
MDQVLSRIDGLIKLTESEAAASEAAASKAAEPLRGAPPPMSPAAHHGVASPPPMGIPTGPLPLPGPPAPAPIVGGSARPRGKSAPGATSSEGMWSMARGHSVGVSGGRAAIAPVTVAAKLDPGTPDLAVSGAAQLGSEGASGVATAGSVASAASRERGGGRAVGSWRVTIPTSSAAGDAAS